MEKYLRFVLIGCGRIAQRHAEQIDRVGKLIAVCDINADQYLPFVKKYNCHGYEKLDDLLTAEKDKADIAVICTPNGLHAAQGIACLENGWHVLCEKPMAIMVQPAKEMIEAADASGKNLFIIQSYRYHPATQNVKKLISEKKLGRILSFQLNCFWNRPPAYYNNTWKGSSNMDGGILYTQFSHFIDLLCWYFGEIKSAAGITKNFFHDNIELEDTGMAILEYENGIVGNIHYTINSFKKNMEGSLTIFGEKGTLKLGGAYCNELAYYEAEEDISQVRKDENALRVLSNHDKIYDDVVNILKSSPQQHYLDPLNGLKTVIAIDKIYQSVKRFNKPL